MAIRLSSNCTNCDSLTTESICNIHQVKVSENYTCESFSFKASLKEDRQCTTCARHTTESCAHPDKAAEGMLCSSWAPVASN